MIVNGGICRDRNHQMLRKRRGIGCVVLYSVADGKLCGLFGFLSIRHGRLCICTMQRGGQGTFCRRDAVFHVRLEFADGGVCGCLHRQFGRKNPV